MAREGALSPDTSSPAVSLLLLLLFLLVLIPSSMAENEEILPSSPSRSGSVDSDHLKNISSRRHKLTVGAKSPALTSQNVSPQVSSTNTVRGRKGGGKQGPRVRRHSPLPWQEKIFDTDEHEVPSGPNPISNR